MRSRFALASALRGVAATEEEAEEEAAAEEAEADLEAEARADPSPGAGVDVADDDAAACPAVGVTSDGDPTVDAGVAPGGAGSAGDDAAAAAVLPASELGRMCSDTAPIPPAPRAGACTGGGGWSGLLMAREACLCASVPPPARWMSFERPSHHLRS